MKKHKILFVANVALFASICFLGCQPEPEDEEVFTKISEFKPAAGTYSCEMTAEASVEEKDLPEGASSLTESMKINGRYVIEGTEDDSKVSQTCSSVIVTVITKYSSEDSYNTAKDTSTSSSTGSFTVEYSFDDTNYIITAKAVANESYVESLSEEWTYQDFISSINDNSRNVEIYFSNRGNYKLIVVDDSSTQTVILTLQ